MLLAQSYLGEIANLAYQAYGEDYVVRAVKRWPEYGDSAAEVEKRLQELSAPVPTEEGSWDDYFADEERRATFLIFPSALIAGSVQRVKARVAELEQLLKAAE